MSDIVVLDPPIPSGFFASLHVTWRWILVTLLANAVFIAIACAIYTVRYQLVHQQFPGRKRKRVADLSAMVTPTPPRVQALSSPRRRLRALPLAASSD